MNPANGKMEDTLYVCMNLNVPKPNKPNLSFDQKIKSVKSCFQEF